MQSMMEADADTNLKTFFADKFEQIGKKGKSRRFAKKCNACGAEIPDTTAKLETGLYNHFIMCAGIADVDKLRAKSLKLVLDEQRKKSSNSLNKRSHKEAEKTDNLENAANSQNFVGKRNRKRKMVDESNEGANARCSMTTSAASPRDTTNTTSAKHVGPFEEPIDKMFTNLFQHMAGGNAPSATASNPLAGPSIDRSKLYDTLINAAGSADPIEFIIASIRLPDEYAEILRMFGIHALLGEYCKRTQEKFVEQMQGYGFNHMMATKLYYWLENISHQLIK